MTKTFALDVYGTLIDPMAIAKRLKEVIGDDAGPFSQQWRAKQLEYSFRRGLMNDYEDFSVVTAQAFDFTAQTFQIAISNDVRTDILGHYTRLDAFPETRTALTTLRRQGAKLYAFSNGKPDDLASLLTHAEIDTLLDGIVSVHDIRSFKPNPAVYQHFESASGASSQNIWLVSGNPFDILGAKHCGWQTAWIKRSPEMIFDPWGPQPSKIIETLEGLLDLPITQS